MTEAVFKPLRMNQTSYLWSDTSPLNLATFYKSDSSIAPHYKYTSLASSSLYTNITDFCLFLKANFTDNAVLERETINLMNTIHTPTGQGMHGLGPMIFAKKGSGDMIIGHDGVSLDAINNAARINLKTKDGIVVFGNGNWGFASKLADEWGFWKTGIPNNTIMSSNLTRLITLLVVGYLIILISSIYIIRKKLKKMKG